MADPGMVGSRISHINLFEGGPAAKSMQQAGLWSLLALPGIVVWWQGIQNWKRGLGVRLKSGWKRFNWDLHSSFGFWTFLLTLMWGLTGVFAAIPDPFRATVDYLEPLQRIETPVASPASPGTRGIAQSQEGQAGQSGPRGQRGQRGGRGRRPQFKPRVGDQTSQPMRPFGNFADEGRSRGDFGPVPGC
jgi:uncharacterized iron-regulated membrane protein